MQTIEYLSKLYDDLYEEADNILKEYNPCKINKKGVCVANELCCCSKGEREQCKYLGKKGCTTDALGCRVFLCFRARLYSNGEAHRQLKVIKNIANKYNLLKYRASKEDTLNDLKNKNIWHLYRKSY